MAPVQCDGPGCPSSDLCRPCDPWFSLLTCAWSRLAIRVGCHLASPVFEGQEPRNIRIQHNLVSYFPHFSCSIISICHGRWNRPVCTEGPEEAAERGFLLSRVKHGGAEDSERVTCQIALAFLDDTIYGLKM